MSKPIRCAIYTRKSTEDGLKQDFNSLDAQREACEAFIQSQRSLGWKLVKARYDDGGLSGGTMDRPALQNLLADIDAGRVDLVVVYKVDRLTRSLSDFAKIIEKLDTQEASFVSVTQQFNTTTSMGRLTLNVLLSFAQFEREVTAERIRDKITASKKKGMWMGGQPPLGYDARDKKLVINKDGARTVRELFRLYLELGSVQKLKKEADRLELSTQKRKIGDRTVGGKPFSRGHLYQLLNNQVYIGNVVHKGKVYLGKHEGIISQEVWDATQKQLKENTTERNSDRNLRQPSSLTGLIYDEAGSRLSPTYTTKKGRRYRYYVSANPPSDPENTDRGWRIPARELEKAVEAGICEYLNDQTQVANEFLRPSASPEHVERAIRDAFELARLISTCSPEEKYRLLRKILHKVKISDTSIEISLFKYSLGFRLPESHVNATATKTLIRLNLTLEIRRRGIERKIIIASPKRREPDERLITLIAKSFYWFNQILKGEVSSIREIAHSETIDEGDVSRFLSLAFLSPSIVENILIGKHPAELTSEQLKRKRKISNSWQKQSFDIGLL